MRRTVVVLVVSFCLLVLVAKVLGQGLPSGSIAGAVTSSPDGLPLPGVSITVRSAALQGVRQTVSEAGGGFLIPNLPPGEYAVVFELEGFDTVTENGVRVGTSQRQDLAVAMSVKAVSEAILVTASTDLVSKVPQAATIMEASLIDELPISRTVESVVLLAPGVNTTFAGKGITISGAESYQSSFAINGVQTQDNQWGTPQPLYIEDAVSEMTTLTSGISAEYGRFAGGHVNVLTKSGGNVLSGSFRATLVNDAWSAETPAGEEHQQDVTPIWEATLGGPLWKDRVWLFGAGRLYDQTTTDQLAPPVSTDFEKGENEKRYELKVTASPLESQTLTLSYLHLSRTDSNMRWGWPVLELAALHQVDTTHQLFLANWTGVLSSSLFGEVSYGSRRYEASGFGSQNQDLVRGTGIVDIKTSAGYNTSRGCAVCPDAADKRSSEHWVAKATALFSTESFGSHTVVSGVERYATSWQLNHYLTGSDYFVWAMDILYENGTLYPVIAPGSMIWYAPVSVLARPDDAKVFSAYLNDTWRLGRDLTFNVGLRWDKNEVRDVAGNLQSTEGAWSPRLGVAWDPAGEGRLRLTASASRYVSTVSESQMYWASTPGMLAVLTYIYAGPGINVDPAAPRVSTADALMQVFSWFGVTAPHQPPPAPFAPVGAWYPGVTEQMRGGLRSPRADELTLGVNGSLGTKGSYRVEGVYRKYADFTAYRLDRSTGTARDPMGNVYDLSIMESVNAPLERRHVALRTSFQANLSTSFAVSGSWTWSRTWGNQSSEESGNGPAAQSGILQYPEYHDLAWSNPVSEDVRHRVRLWATWDMSFIPASLGTFSLTPLFALDTGQPYGLAGEILIQPYVENPGYVTPPRTVMYSFTPPDAYRTPTVTSLDLALNWSLKLGTVQLFVQPQVLNVTNRDAVVTADGLYVETGVRTAAYFDDLQPFNPFTEKPVEGVHYAKSPTFGRPTTIDAYQQPRTFKISLGLRF